jgi:hypothetical protein
MARSRRPDPLDECGNAHSSAILRPVRRPSAATSDAAVGWVCPARRQAMTGKGQEEPFPARRLSGREAPIPVIGETTIDRLKSTQSCRSSSVRVGLETGSIVSYSIVKI